MRLLYIIRLQLTSKILHFQASLIITTNRKIEKWTELFYDPVMANAALDRIVNNAYRIILEGESYRKNFIPKFNMEDDKAMETI